MSLRIRLVSANPVAVVALEGDLDYQTEPLMDDWLAENRDDLACPLVLNMEKVELLDSTGIGVLIRLWKERRSAFALAAMTPRNRRVLQVRGLRGMLPVYDTVEEASQAVRAAGVGGPPS